MRWRSLGDEHGGWQQSAIFCGRYKPSAEVGLARWQHYRVDPLGLDDGSPEGPHHSTCSSSGGGGGAPRNTGTMTASRTATKASFTTA